MIQSTDTYLCRLRVGVANLKKVWRACAFPGEPNCPHISVQPGEPVRVAGGADTEEKASWRGEFGAEL